MLGRHRPNVQKLARRGKASRLLRALSYRDELTDRDGNVFDLGVDIRRQAAVELADFEGLDVFDALVAALDDAGTRGAAATALGQLHDSRATEALIELLHEPEPEIRAAAARALGAIKDPRAVEALVAAAPDPEYEVREAAIQALEGLWSVAALSELRERLSGEHEGLGS